MQKMFWIASGLTFFACRATAPADASPSPHAETGASSGSRSGSVQPIGTDPGRVGQGAPLESRPGPMMVAFAAGSFGGVEVVSRKVPGFTISAVGYGGGHPSDPTYERVC